MGCTAYPQPFLRPRLSSETPFLLTLPDLRLVCCCLLCSAAALSLTATRMGVVGTVGAMTVGLECFLDEARYR